MKSKYYILGDQYDEGSFAVQIVKGGRLYFDKSKPVAVFVPDPTMTIFDTIEELDWRLRYDAPLTEGARAWIEEKVRRENKRYGLSHLGTATLVEREARTYIANGEPLIYTFAESSADASKCMPMDPPKPWWKRFLGV